MDAQDSTHADVCPECGAAQVSGAEKCWLCAVKLTQPRMAEKDWTKLRLELPPEVPRIRPSGILLQSPAPQPPANLGRTFSLSTLFLWITLAAVVMGVIRLAPGLGIALAVVSLPSAFLTMESVRQNLRRGKSATVSEKVLLFLAWSSVAMALLLSFFGALFTVCGLAFSSIISPRGTMSVDFLLMAVAALVAAAVIYAVWMIRRLG